MKRSIVGGLAAFALASVIVLASGQAAEAATVTATVGGISYSADNSSVAAGAAVTGYSGAGGAVIIPDSVSIDGTSYAVTSVGTFAFNGLSSLTSITLPDSLLTLQNGAIEFNPNLTSIHFGDSLTYIGIQAVEANHLTSIELPASLTGVDSYAFFDNPLTSVLFEGNAPTTFWPAPFAGYSFGPAAGVTVSYDVSATGFTTPTWEGYNTSTVAKVSYDLNGHGAAIPASYAPPGAAHAAPPAPTATGFQFGGWFSDPSLTTPADFSATISTDTTEFAKWTADPVLPTTGVSIPPYVIPSAIELVILGALLLLISRRRRTS